MRRRSRLSDAARPDFYRLTIKRLGARAEQSGAGPGLVSSHFHDRLAIGDRIEAKAPAGAFTLDVEQDEPPAVLIGGGIGITPLLSMLNTLVAAESAREIWLLYSVGDEREHIMRTHLESLASAHANVHLHIFYSRSTADCERPGMNGGRIDLPAMQRWLPSKDCDFYICGPPAMLDSVTRALEAWGVPSARVHMEAFGPATVKRVHDLRAIAATSRS